VSENFAPQRKIVWGISVGNGVGNLHNNTDKLIVFGADLHYSLLLEVNRIQEDLYLSLTSKANVKAPGERA
jgi:hypothetical protein